MQLMPILPGEDVGVVTAVEYSAPVVTVRTQSKCQPRGVYSNIDDEELAGHAAYASLKFF